MQWREITSADGRFHVSAPADLIKEVKDIPYGEWRVSESNFRASVPKLGFLVGYIDLPAGMLKTEPNEVLNTELDERVQAAGVELLSKEATRFAGYPAVRFKLHYMPGGVFVEGILLLAKQRRYQLAVHYTSESSAQDCEKFFHSFQVLDGP